MRFNGLGFQTWGLVMPLPPLDGGAMQVSSTTFYIIRSNPTSHTHFLKKNMEVSQRAPSQALTPKRCPPSRDDLRRLQRYRHFTIRPSKQGTPRESPLRSAPFYPADYQTLMACPTKQESFPHPFQPFLPFQVLLMQGKLLLGLSFFCFLLLDSLHRFPDGFSLFGLHHSSAQVLTG